MNFLNHLDLFKFKSKVIVENLPHNTGNGFPENTLMGTFYV